MAHQEHINDLLHKILTGSPSPEELHELAEMIKKDTDGAVVGLIEEALQQAAPVTGSALPGREKCDEIVNRILATDKSVATTHKKPAPVFRLYKRLAAAAVIIIMVGIGTLLWLSNRQKSHLAEKELLSAALHEDVLPGRNQAVLKLADGSTIVLDSAGNGVLAQQGNTKVLKASNGQLEYVSSGMAEEPVFYNTITTPRGGQYQLVLPDGSKVWLNAASSLRFPARFSGTERTVELDGEGYFEVAKNEKMPFSVKLHDNSSVRVLGTHFNVMAYRDENTIKTSLLEGMVKVSKNENSCTLKPGQQAVLDNTSNTLQVKDDIDLDEAVAWKNGYFLFNKIDAQAMRQISRWYNVDLVYEGVLKEKEYAGKIDRNVKLSNVIDALKIIGIQCRVEKGKLIITP